jgi:glutathione S-transferase
MPSDGHALIAEADGPFKAALDRTKYASRYPGEDKLDHRACAAKFLYQLDQRLQQGYLFGPNPTLADMAILPFVRQFAFIDKDWFDAQDWPDLKRWLEAFLASGLFLAVMGKYPKWQAGDAATIFPASANI